MKNVLPPNNPPAWSLWYLRNWKGSWSVGASGWSCSPSPHGDRIVFGGDSGAFSDSPFPAAGCCCLDYGAFQSSLWKDRLVSRSNEPPDCIIWIQKLSWMLGKHFFDLTWFWFFLDFQRFSSIFGDFLWFPLVFIDFQWFPMIFKDFQWFSMISKIFMKSDFIIFRVSSADVPDFFQKKIRSRRHHVFAGKRANPRVQSESPDFFS